MDDIRKRNAKELNAADLKRAREKHLKRQARKNAKQRKQTQMQ